MSSFAVVETLLGDVADLRELLPPRLRTGPAAAKLDAVEAGLGLLLPREPARAPSLADMRVYRLSICSLETFRVAKHTSADDDRGAHCYLRNFSTLADLFPQWQAGTIRTSLLTKNQARYVVAERAFRTFVDGRFPVEVARLDRVLPDDGAPLFLEARLVRAWLEKQLGT